MIRDHFRVLVADVSTGRGTVVLEDGRSGVVVGSTDDLTRPVVQLVYDERKQERLRPQQVDLSQTGGTIASYGDPARLGSTSKTLLEKLLQALS